MDGPQAKKATAVAGDQPVSIAGSANGVYTYDGNKKRIKSVVNGQTLYTIYDHAGALMEVYDASTLTRTDTIRAAGQTIARVSGSTVTWLHNDHLGSAATGTNVSGNISWSERDTPRVKSGQAFPVNRFKRPPEWF